MADYLFLDDGRRVDVSDGRVLVFPDHGFNFRDASRIGNIERSGGGWHLTRNGRDVGYAPNKRAAVLQLLEDAADDIAAKEREKQAELELYHEAVAAVQELLPGYRSSPEPFGPFLVFEPAQILDLLAAAGEQIEDDDEVERLLPPEPSAEDLDRFAAEHLGITFADDPAGIVQLAVIGITNGAWRNTHLENLHASDHASGGFPDADMMRYNIATTRLVARFVSAEALDWFGLHRALTDPDRVLPGGLTVGELAGDELGELTDDVDRSVWDCHMTERHHGLPYALTRFAMHGGAACSNWYGTPWWDDVVAVFVEQLDDPDSDAWRYDDGSRPQPASVADRAALAETLRTEPEALDDAGIYWCLRHGLDYPAAHRGFARWRTRRDPSWEDPHPV